MTKYTDKKKNDSVEIIITYLKDVAKNKKPVVSHSIKISEKSSRRTAKK